MNFAGALKARWHILDNERFGVYLSAQAVVPVRFPPSRSALAVGETTDPAGHDQLLVVLQPTLPDAKRIMLVTRTLDGRLINWLDQPIRVSRDYGHIFRMYLGKKLLRTHRLPIGEKDFPVDVPTLFKEVTIRDDQATLALIPINRRGR